MINVLPANSFMKYCRDNTTLSSDSFEAISDNFKDGEKEEALGSV